MTKKIKVKLYFPDNETGEVSCSYTNMMVDDYTAQLTYDPDDLEAVSESESVIAHWLKNGATIVGEGLDEGAEILVSFENDPEDEEVSDDNSS